MSAEDSRSSKQIRALRRRPHDVLALMLASLPTWQFTPDAAHALDVAGGGVHATFARNGYDPALVTELRYDNGALVVTLACCPALGSA